MESTETTIGSANAFLRRSQLASEESVSLHRSGADRLGGRSVRSRPREADQRERLEGATVKTRGGRQSDTEDLHHLDLYRTSLRTSSQDASKKREECPNPISFYREKVDKQTGEIFREEMEKPCGTKGCRVCGPELATRYTAHYIDEFKSLMQDGALSLYFLTLTVDRKVKDKEGKQLQRWDSRKYLRWCWGNYYHRLRRRSEEMQYVGAFEPHKDGFWHMHLLVAVRFSDGYLEKRSPQVIFRNQWFESGGGAVVDTKRLVSFESGGMDADNRPSTVPGSVGYIVKYIFKDSRKARRRGLKRKSQIASRGLGYHSERAKEKRRAYAKKQEEVTDSEASEGEVSEWIPSTVGRSKPFEDTLTENDRERFARFDREDCTDMYREKREGSWREYVYEAGTVWWRDWDKYPEAEGAQVIGSGGDRPEPS